MYLSWSAFYEGVTDQRYLNILIPRLLEDIILTRGRRPCDVGEFPAVEFGINKRSFDSVADQICLRRREFHILFVHADLGGRHTAGSLRQRREQLVEMASAKCGFDPRKAVLLSPNRELEAWALADEDAVKTALGVRSLTGNLMPRDGRHAERLSDPKAMLDGIVRGAQTKMTSSGQVLVRIAQEQRLSCLRSAPSFTLFENDLCRCLSFCNFID